MMRSLRNTFVAGASWIVIPVWSPHPNVFISQVHEPNEPSVAVDPRHPLHIVGGANQNNVYTSQDGGQTWMDSDIRVDSIPGGWNFNIPGLYRANGFPVTPVILAQVLIAALFTSVGRIKAMAHLIRMSGSENPRPAV